MKRIPLPLEEIEKLYLVDCLTVREIAERYGVSSQTISYRLSTAGVPARPRGQMRPAVDRKTLETVYYVEKLTVQRVAERLGCSLYKISRAMDRYGMARRRRPLGIGLKYAELDNLGQRFSRDGEACHPRQMAGFPLPERTSPRHAGIDPTDQREDYRGYAG